MSVSLVAGAHDRRATRESCMKSRAPVFGRRFVRSLTDGPGTETWSWPAYAEQLPEQRWPWLRVSLRPGGLESKAGST